MGSPVPQQAESYTGRRPRLMPGDGRRLATALPLLVTGGWFVLRAGHTLAGATERLPAGYAAAQAGAATVSPSAAAAASLVLGVALAVAALWLLGARQLQRAPAWLAATGLLLLALLLPGGLWWLGFGFDWVACALVFVAALALVWPSTRAFYLG
jgi:hypothetical protein